ncbi:MAG: glycosidase, partial [Flavisolibacter sp.]
MKVIKSNIRLYASAEAVINQFLVLPGKDRVKHIVERVKDFSEEEVSKCLSDIIHDFASRHRNIEEVLLDHFNKVSLQYSNDISTFSRPRKLVLGAFFTKEYSIHTAALFNPSIVSHPDQKNLSSDQQRFIMSLRATGEGHISSIIFKTGIVD